MTDCIRRLDWTILILLCMVASGACRCKETVNPIDAGACPPSLRCDNDAECVSACGSARWICVVGTCEFGPLFCEDLGDAECCPGQTCNRGGVCADDYDSCTTDADCGTAGQKCLNKPINGLDQDVCTFELCVTGSCAAGLTCFAGWCVGENPCGGSCPADSACSVSNNRCQPTCTEVCDPGFLAAYTPPDNIDDACDFDQKDCTCVALPPLSARDTGRHSGIAVLDDGTAHVSAFDGDHGDLVVVTFDATGTITDTTWIDGLPAGGTPVADPSGPRGGIADPGPEVGRFTDIAAQADGTLHVSYYDVDNRDLKYARGSGGTWSTHTVDSAGRVGLYTSIALDGTGVPTIAYFQKAGASGDEYTTALKAARASSNAPTTAGDWSIVTVESGTIAPPPCGGSCVTGTSCADIGNGPECLVDQTPCAVACSSGEVCIDDAGTPSCEPELVASSLEDLPEGIGLFPAISVSSTGGTAIAYYNRTAGDLHFAVGVDPNAGNSGALSVLDGGPDKDVGLFPSIALDGSGDYVVIYQDAVADDVLWALVSAAGAVNQSGIVDEGLRDPTGNATSLVGADTAVVLTGGKWVVAYHDGTGGDLVVSTRDAAGNWTRKNLVTQGSAGFWTDAARTTGGAVYISHVVILGVRSGPLDSTLRVEIVPNP